MKYISLFTGVGGFDLGFNRAGMECVGQAESDAFCLKVLAHHWPDTPRVKDVRDVNKSTFAACDLVCGGFPCQDVSVAGNRAGLAGERSGLWFEFLRVLHELKPSWVVIENVPGLLSSNSGRDFATILHGLGECGYQSAWRILDSQYWGVAQRRRRLFLVGCLTDGRAAEVLFERKGGYWNTPTRREAGQGIAAPVKASAPSRRNGGSSPTEGEFIVPTTYREQANGVYQGDTKASPVKARDGKSATDLIAYRVTGNTNDYPRNVYVTKPDTTGSLRVKAGDDNLFLLNPKIQGVRRLTPLECERLQGFPDGWTDVDGMSDAQRYRQMGNAVTVSVTEWLGRRIVAAGGIP